MKYIFCLIILSLMIGCASVPSEYAQGCYDGIANAFGGEDILNKPRVRKECDELDQAHRAEKNIEKEMNHR